LKVYQGQNRRGNGDQSEEGNTIMLLVLNKRNFMTFTQKV
jgi:hypothetical protein